MIVVHVSVAQNKEMKNGCPVLALREAKDRISRANCEPLESRTPSVQTPL